MRVNVFHMAVLLCTLLISCIRDENTYDNTPQPISFQPVIQNVRTRSNNVFDTKKNFGVYAWIGMTDVEVNHGLYIENEKATFTHSSWSTVTPSYWPFSGYLDFFCYTPYRKNHPQPTVTVTADYRQNQIEYKDITANDKTPDYMYTNKAINQNQGTSGAQGVPLIFNHALAMVKIGVRISSVDDGKGKTWKVRLKQFNITNITNKGGVLLSLQDNKMYWKKPNPAVWNETPGQKEIWNLLPSGVKEITTTQPVSLKEALVIPQTLEDEMNLSIEYDLLTTEKGTTNTDTKTINIALNSITSAEGPIIQWEMNKLISYNVVINPPSTRKPLLFAPTVEDWLNDNTSVEVVPK